MLSSTVFFTDDFGKIFRKIYIDCNASFEAVIYPTKGIDGMFTLDAIGRRANKEAIIVKHRDNPLTRQEIEDLADSEATKFLYGY